MSPEIVKGVPMPPAAVGQSRYPWKNMVVGDCFFVPDDHPRAAKRMAPKAYDAARRLGVKFSVRRTTHQGRPSIGVWRVK